jgi:nucleotide-binding universal stress UspA family protein
MKARCAVFKTILHPTDFSERSEAALAAAVMFAREYGARLVVLHVSVPPAALYGEGAVPLLPGEWRANMKRTLDRLASPDPAVALERRIEDGDPADTVVRVAREIGADVIIMGTHGRSGLSRLLLGSVAESVLRKADGMVMTIKTPMKEPAAEPAAAAVGGRA